MIKKLWLALTLFLCACSGAMVEDRTLPARASAPFFFTRDERPTAGETLLENERDVYRPLQDNSPALASRERIDASHGFGPQAAAVPKGCGIKDRFDRAAAVAYNFDDNQSRLALHMTVDGFGLGGAEIEKAMVKFHYKFQPIKNRKERCRYPSGFQGLVGSSYNEFFLRENNTVMQELRDMNPLGLFE